MRWFLVRLRTHCMFVIHCVIVKSIAWSLNKLYVRWIHDLVTRKLSWCFCICLRSSIEINCSNSLLDMRLIRNRIFVTKNSYESHEDCFLIHDNKIDWFLRLDVLDTIYDEEISHWRMSKSIYSRWLFNNCIHDRLHEIDWFQSNSWNICSCSRFKSTTRTK